MTNLNPLAFECIGLALTWVLSKVSHKSIEKVRELEIILFQNDENIDIRLVKSNTYVRPGKQRHKIDGLSSIFCLVLMTFLCPVSIQHEPRCYFLVLNSELS